MDTPSIYSLIMVIIDFGQATKAIKIAKSIGATGGTIVLGKGTVKSSILSRLGLDESRKEIALIGVESHIEQAVNEALRAKLELDKPNHGIVFSVPMKRAIGKNFKDQGYTPYKEGDNKMKHEAIFTIVNKGMSKKVIDSASKAGSTGGTVISGRGSGTEVTEKLFNIDIEPEKDIVLIISKLENTDQIVEAISQSINITEQGKGIIFVLDVNRTIGLYDANKKA